jgi:hypothetical protein
VSPRFLRYRFPSDPPAVPTSPEAHARALAHLFGAVPAHELSIGRLDAIAGQWAHDPGTLEVAFGAGAGVPLGDWTRLVVGPGGRIAYLDVDLDELGQAIARGKALHRSAL